MKLLMPHLASSATAYMTSLLTYQHDTLLQLTRRKCGEMHHSHAGCSTLLVAKFPF